MFEIEEILDRVDELEEERAPYRRAAEDWEKMWALKAFDKPAERALEEDAQEQVTVPTPYNVVHLARRLISTDPRIEVPAADANDDEDQAAVRRERFLSAFWQRANKEQRRVIAADVAWQALVRGRFVLEVTWVKDLLPKRLKERRLPILVRTLDPMNVGIKQGPLYTEYAYHKYTERRSAIKQRYPDLDLGDTKGKSRGGMYSEDELDVIDFWWTDQSDGSIWHAVLVDRHFAIEPVQTDYPDIPIVEGYGDSAPVKEEEFRSVSILHPIKGTWEYHCRLASQVGTGLLFYFWPAILVSNDSGQEVDDFEVRPGTTTTVPPGTNVNIVRADVNVPLAQNMISMIDRMQQESTFPGVMYGDSGSMQAGYGVSILADAARGRVNMFRRNMESAIEHADELILGLVETFAGRDGVKVWAKSEKSGEIYHEVLTPSDISGNYENMVSLAPQVPSDDLQKQTMGLRMVQDGIMSKRTFRDRQANIMFPDDEETRITTERMWDDPAFASKKALRAFQETYPDSWQTLIAGTPLEQEAQKQEEAKRKEEMANMPPELAAMLAGGPMPGPGMPPMQGAMPGPGPMGPPMMGPGGAPPIQPDGMGPVLGPPEAQGMLTPEMMGLGPTPPPGLFQEMTGQPLSEEDMLRQQLGLPPGTPL